MTVTDFKSCFWQVVNEIQPGNSYFSKVIKGLYLAYSCQYIFPHIKTALRLWCTENKLQRIKGPSAVKMAKSWSFPKLRLSSLPPGTQPVLTIQGQCKQRNQCSAWQIAGAEDSSQISSAWQKLCDQPLLSMFSFLLHTQYLPLRGVWFSARSACWEMPPSFCVAGQLQAFLVSPQQKAQIAEKPITTTFWTSQHCLLLLQKLRKYQSGTHLWYSLSRTVSIQKNDLLIYLTPK